MKEMWGRGRKMEMRCTFHLALWSSSPLRGRWEVIAVGFFEKQAAAKFFTSQQNIWHHENKQKGNISIIQLKKRPYSCLQNDLKSKPKWVAARTPKWPQKYNFLPLPPVRPLNSDYLVLRLIKGLKLETVLMRASGSQLFRMTYLDIFLHLCNANTHKHLPHYFLYTLFSSLRASFSSVTFYPSLLDRTHRLLKNNRYQVTMLPPHGSLNCNYSNL